MKIVSIFRCCAFRSRGQQPTSVSRLLPTIIFAVAAACIGFVTESVGYSQDEEPLDEIPETRVVGRPESTPDPFPANPVAEDTVLSANRVETTASSVSASVTVITAEQIARSRHTTVTEVLRSVPGLTVVQSGGPGQISSVFIRGGNSAHTKVILDGIPLNDPSGASRAFDFANLTVDNIERIEVLRGPQSAQYGSDAIGGVVSIVTKRGEGPPRATASVMGGSFGTNQQRVGVSGGTDQAYYSFTGSHFYTDGFSAVSRQFGGIEPDGFENISFSGRYGWSPNEQLNVDYVFRYSDGLAEIDFFAENPTSFLRQKQFYNRVQAQTFSLNGKVEQKFGAAKTDYDRRSNVGTPAFHGKLYFFDYQANVFVTEWNTFTFGADYSHENSVSTNTALRTQHNKGAYIQDQMQLSQRASVNASVRWDDHSNAGRASTYRVGGVYDICETGTRFHASLGTGFRSPALSELDPFFAPNGLNPERSRGWDVGVEQKMGPCVLVDVTYFDNRFTDLIQFNLANFQLQNIGAARANGVETTFNLEWTPRTGFDATYTFTDSLDVNANRYLLRRPRHRATFGVNHRLPGDRARISAYALYVGEREDNLFAFPFGPVELDDYITVNLSGAVQMSRDVELFARIDNLFGEAYEETSGFQGTPFSVFGGISVAR